MISDKEVAMHQSTIAVVIPCFRVRQHILSVIENIGPEVSTIIVVDDCCTENTGEYVRDRCNDSRVEVVQHSQNTGVGGATLSGMQRAFDSGCDFVVKMDGDDQMDPKYILAMATILRGKQADFVKGNRFYNLEDLRSMPFTRLCGNAVLSFFAKLSTGYYNIFDPTNGYIAINREAFQSLQTQKLSRRYFFETDLLFRLYLARAVVRDLPMKAKYGDEISNLKISSILLPFLAGHIRNFSKRLFYCYVLRDFSVTSVYLLSGGPLVIFGLIYGTYEWHKNDNLGIATPAGTVALAGLPIIIGFNLLLSFLTLDVGNIPQSSLKNNTLHV